MSLMFSNKWAYPLYHNMVFERNNYALCVLFVFFFLHSWYIGVYRG